MKSKDLNLGKVAWDSQRNIAENRSRLLKHLEAESMDLVVPNQIHSDLIHVLGPEYSAARAWTGDGLATNHPDLLLSIQTADCYPILLVDARLRIVAAVHCGWRGTLRRLAKKAVGVMKFRYGSRDRDLWAAIGPGIGACCYQVGQEVRDEFQGQFYYAAKLFTTRWQTATAIQRKYPLLFKHVRNPFGPVHPEVFYLDLAKANAMQLREAGLSVSKIHVASQCTSCHPDLFFSHRRDLGKTGRMMAVIGIRSCN